MIETHSARILCSNSLEEMDKCISDWIFEFETILDTETQFDSSYIHPPISAICNLIQKFYKMEFNNSENNVKKVTSTRSSTSSSFTPNYFKNLNDSTQMEEKIHWQSPSAVPGLMNRSMFNLDVDADLAHQTVSLSNDNGYIINF